MVVLVPPEACLVHSEQNSSTGGLDGTGMVSHHMSSVRAPSVLIRPPTTERGLIECSLPAWWQHDHWSWQIKHDKSKKEQDHQKQKMWLNWVFPPCLVATHCQWAASSMLRRNHQKLFPSFCWDRTTKLNCLCDFLFSVVPTQTKSKQPNTLLIFTTTKCKGSKPAKSTKNHIANFFSNLEKTNEK